MSEFKGLITRDIVIKEAIKKMTGSAENKFIAGLAVVVDENNKVTGVLTDGDIRRGISKGISIDSKIEEIANFNPIMVNKNLAKNQMAKDIVAQCAKKNKSYMKYSKIILINDDGTFYDVILASDIFDDLIENKTVVIYGMGYIGLTLATVFANADLSVIGIDKSKDIIENLKRGKPHFFENGLESLLNSTLQNNSINFETNSDDVNGDIYIVCVGTPFDKNNKTADLSSINLVSEEISKKLKTGDLVIFRSTVPIGTIKEKVKPVLEKSGLTAGEDFYLSFAPERTIEGKAIEELYLLPQIIGGINKKSTELTAKLFSKITKTIIEVDTLEEAELVKLINNSFRDLVFSFSNEVAFICDYYNINAFKLIDSANEGYKRNPIPKPSPGVGGMCLVKDPFLYSLSKSVFNDKAALGVISRKINSYGATYVYNKITDFCGITKKDLKDLKIFIIGIAFKGMPETSDIRDSVAVDLINMLPVQKNIFVKDFVVGKKEIENIRCNYVENINDGFKDADITLVMNNHYKNNQINLIDAFKYVKNPFLFFDGWNMFNQDEIEKNKNCFYSTMGYITRR